jgi:hypothetical protein
MGQSLKIVHFYNRHQYLLKDRLHVIVVTKEPACKGYLLAEVLTLSYLLSLIFDYPLLLQVSILILCPLTLG